MLHRLMRTGRVLVDGKAAGAACRVRQGQDICVLGLEARPEGAPLHKNEEPWDAAPLYILFENEDLLILNKPCGVSSHGPDSLESVVRQYLAPRLAPSLSFRPGPVNRLDKGSSGVIVFSVSLAGARCFSALLQKRSIKKEYLAIVDGIVAAGECWEDTLVRDRAVKKTLLSNQAAAQGRGEDGPKQALTRLWPLAHAARHSLVLAEILTGRTHQIRAQAAAHGHPLSADKKYGSVSLEGSSFFLHAWKLELDAAAQEALPALPHRITAPLPDPFLKKIQILFPSFHFNRDNTDGTG